MKKINDRVLLLISVAGFLLMSCSFVLMPIDSMRILPGILFWGGLLTGVALQIVLEIRRREFFAQYKVKREKMQKTKVGLLTFCSNKTARIVDYAMAVSAVALILFYIITKGLGFICYVFIATSLFAFCLHCILNGRIYFYVNNQAALRKAIEGNKESTSKKGEGKK